MASKRAAKTGCGFSGDQLFPPYLVVGVFVTLATFVLGVSISNVSNEVKVTKEIILATDQRLLNMRREDDDNNVCPSQLSGRLQYIEEMLITLRRGKN